MFLDIQMHVPILIMLFPVTIFQVPTDVMVAILQYHNSCHQGIIDSHFTSCTATPCDGK